ncbi:MAG: N-acetylneuraminate synthase [Candidatus Omnitrophota bacterium]|jgi:N,N'-diacetyllegionaminate synthase
MKNFILEMRKRKKVFIIAEAGINHNGSVIIAKKMIDAAADAQADAVKFQTFKAEKEISRFAPKAEYQKITTDSSESQLNMARKLELTKNEFRELFGYCAKKRIIFLSSPSEIESLDFLAELGLTILKIPSGEITNLPYLRKAGSLGKQIIISTGMATMKEVSRALDVLIKAGTPKKKITILHCNTEYPTPFRDVNLLAMLTIKDVLGVDAGYSDHTLGIEVPIAAAALGAKVIEKHFTLDRNMSGPDHASSLLPSELEAMVKSIRNIEIALGDGIKKPSLSEIKNIIIVRKSIVAAKNIKKGERFNEDNITSKRPGSGISPLNWDRLIGKIAKRDFHEDEALEL